MLRILHSTFHISYVLCHISISYHRDEDRLLSSSLSSSSASSSSSQSSTIPIEVEQLPSRQILEPDKRLPDNALINGSFCGSLPQELLGMTHIEWSMVAIINVISKVTLRSKFAISRSKSWCIINKLIRVAHELPRPLCDTGIAFVKTSSNPTASEYKYRPHKVFNALTWLKDNNHLYADINLNFTRWENVNDPNLYRYGEEEILQPDVGREADRLDDSAEGNAANRNGLPGGSDPDVFIVNDVDMDPNTVDSLPENIRRVIHRQNEAFIRYPDGQTVSDDDYSNPVKDVWFWEKAFPMLYPYGRGRPDYARTKTSQYAKYSLMLGNPRSFQGHSIYIFYTFYNVMSMRMGSLAVLASKNRSRFRPTTGDDIDSNAQMEGEYPTAGAVRDMVMNELSAASQPIVQQGNTGIPYDSSTGTLIQPAIERYKKQMVSYQYQISKISYENQISHICQISL